MDIIKLLICIFFHIHHSADIVNNLGQYIFCTSTQQQIPKIELSCVLGIYVFPTLLTVILGYGARSWGN